MSAQGQRRWLITGVGGGLGLALARTALRRGDLVVGVTRQQKSGDALESFAPGKAIGIVANAADPVQARSIVASAVAKLGHLDVLVNNAGYALAGAAEVISDTEAHEQFAANFFGPLALIRESIPHLVGRGGLILNISSLAATQSFRGLGLYCASKAALSALSESVDAELSELGARSVAIEPGGMRTSFAGASLRKAAQRHDRYAAQDKAQDEAFVRSDGHQRGNPVELAEIIFLLSSRQDLPARIVLDHHDLARVEANANRRIDGYREFLNRLQA